MSKKRGRLKSEDEYKIRFNYQFLVDNFDPKDGTLDYLYSKGVFDAHDKDKVINGGENTARGRVERFTNILENSGEQAFSVFIEGLRDRREEIIADKLEKTDVSKVNKEGPFAWIDDLPPEVKKQLLSDSDASRLSAAFGKSWEHVFTELGLTMAKIQQAQMSNSHSTSIAVSNLLVHWRQKHGSKATWIGLLEAMKRANNRCHIEWELVAKVLKEKSEEK